MKMLVYVHQFMLKNNALENNQVWTQKSESSQKWNKCQLNRNKK